MTKKPHSKDFIRDAFSRALSIVLLSFIVYGTTVEAAHRHGNLVTGNPVNHSADFSNPAPDSELSGGLLGCNACLICQLHQGFSSSLPSVPLNLAPEAITVRFSRSSSLVPHSQTRATKSGRGPPHLSV